MIEKNGCLNIDSGEYFQIQLGQVPKRLETNLNLSLQELRDILAKDEYVVTDVSPTTLQSGI
jgi:hypothetical protein